MNAKKLETLKASLPLIKTYNWNRATKDMVEVKIPPTAFIQDGMLMVSGEDGNCFVDYYDGPDGNGDYIHKDLEAWAVKQGGYWEWQNPGAIVFVQ
jgi:hypothetical protein